MRSGGDQARFWRRPGKRRTARSRRSIRGVFSAALGGKIRAGGRVRRNAAAAAPVAPDATKAILGLGIETSGAKFRLRLMREPGNRGGGGGIAAAGGRNGFPEAINAGFPATALLACSVPLIRHSRDFAACGPQSQHRLGARNIRPSRLAAPWGTNHSVVRLSGSGAPDHCPCERGAVRTGGHFPAAGAALIALSRLAPGCGKLAHAAMRRGGAKTHCAIGFGASFVAARRLTRPRPHDS